MKIELWIGGVVGRWCLEFARESPQLLVAGATHYDDLARGSGALLKRGVMLSTGNINQHPPLGDVAVLVHYPEILKPETIKRYRKVYNLHPGFLPFGRGMYPVFWSFLKGEPAGCTLHEIVPKLDAGPIVMQSLVRPAVHPVDGHAGIATTKELHDLVTEAERKLFAEFWPRLLAGTLPEARPAEGAGTYHSRADFEELRVQYAKPGNLMSLGAYSGHDKLLRFIRAFSFPGYPGCVIDGVEFSAKPPEPPRG